MRPPPRTTLFPYTTLFRSLHHLPRKLKVTITGCATRCVYPEVQDVAIFAVPDWERGGVGFRVRVGGGLSTSPRFSQDLGVMLAQDQGADVLRAVALVFDDRNGVTASWWGRR